MACNGKAPCPCEDCGGFTVDDRGFVSTRSGAPMGSRFTRSKRIGGSGSLGSGGPGGSRAATQRTEVAFGSRPAVPERLLDEQGRSLTAREELPPLAEPLAPPMDFVYGPDPRAQFGAGYDPLLTASPVPEAMVRRGQYVPPPPAPQETCLMNAFDPAWGTPPGAISGVPVAFDSALGAYRFDVAHAQAGGNLDQDLVASRTFKELWRRWEQGMMLQPYKVEGSAAWRYRWIPRVRNVVCGPQAYASYSPPTATYATAARAPLPTLPTKAGLFGAADPATRFL